MSSASEERAAGSAAAGQLSVKQERFAQGFVALGSAAEAYRRAYDAAGMQRKSVHEAASRLLRNSKVAARIKLLRAQMALDCGITRMGLILELDEAFAVAKEDRKAPAMIAATMGKARLAGYVDNVPTPAKDRPLALSTGDLLAAHDSVMAAVAAGEISAGDARAYAELLECRRRITETVQFDARLAAIEARLPPNTQQEVRR